MNISTKEIERVRELTDLLHHQWADKDAQRQSLLVARETYRRVMKAHGYEQPDDDVPPLEKFIRASRLRLKVFLGSLRSIGNEEQA